MADEIDIANKQVELELTRHRSFRKDEDVLAPTGYCQNPLCELDIDEPKIFCDGACATEYERNKGGQR